MAGFKLRKELLARDGPEASHILLCLDFGTAACKAAASIGTAENILLFSLGESSGDQTQKYPISSSLFLSSKSQLYFGHEAIRQSRKQRDFVVHRMDSLKSWLSRGDMTDLDIDPIEKHFNPTSIEFSKGDAITILLAFVLDMVTSQLEEKYRVKYVRRRFTRPVLDRARSAWYDKLMVRYITRAQMVADTLSGLWKDGIPIGVVQEVLGQAKEAEIPSWFVEPTGALEPIAAGMSRLENAYDHQSFRSLAVIVDIGAGTTDMAGLSAIQPDGAGEVQKASPEGTPTSALNAGDTLDAILKGHVLNGLNVLSDDKEDVQIQAENDARLWKEQLFTTGITQPTFAGGIVARKVSLETFRRLEAVRNFEGSIGDQFANLLDSITPVAKAYARSMYHSLPYISLIPAGGGARLPIVSTLAGNKRLGGEIFKIKRMDDEPLWFKRAHGGDPNLFPKLAVAIGGASPAFPAVGAGQARPRGRRV